MLLFFMFSVPAPCFSVLNDLLDWERRHTRNG
jgi:hypothetical protein